MSLSQPLDEAQAVRTWIGSMGVKLYGRAGSQKLMERIRHFVMNVEGGAATSHSVRCIFSRYHRVNVGLFTAGPLCLRPGVFHAGTSFGRYTWVADSVRTFTRNHPMNILSTHGFFYNPGLGKVKGSPIEFNALKIGHGVCIGHNAVILPPTSQIGDGAIICPGAVVYCNIPPYTIVSGFPATVKSHRFTKEQIAALTAAEWWKRTPAEFGGDHRELIRSIVGDAAGMNVS